MGGDKLKLRLCYPCEDKGGVAVDENYMVVRHESGVCFSFAQRGNAVMAHFSAKGPALRRIKESINDFCDWVFSALPWAEMIMAVIKKPSVVRLVEKCGFEHLFDGCHFQIYMRVR